MKSKVEKYAAALKSLFYPTWDKIDIHINSYVDARKAYDRISIYLPPFQIYMRHLYYIEECNYVSDKYHYTEYEDKEEWVEYEPTEGEQFTGNYPDYIKKYTRVPVKKCINNGGHYEKKMFRVKSIVLDEPRSFDFCCEGGRLCGAAFNVDHFTTLFIKTDGRGKTFFSYEEIN